MHVTYYLHGFVKVTVFYARKQNSIYGIYCIERNGLCRFETVTTRDFLLYKGEYNNINYIKKKIIISNLFRGSQSSRNDSSGNNEDEKHFVPHRDAAAWTNQTALTVFASVSLI